LSDMWYVGGIQFALQNHFIVTTSAIQLRYTIILTIHTW